MSRVIQLGVTGTRSGMNKHQKQAVCSFFDVLYMLPSAKVDVHHGDCVGADVEFAEIAESYGCRIICHPPVDSKLRGWYTSTETVEPKTYFARNRDIVDASDMLFVVPWQTEWQSNGGTWYTHDYAKKQKRFLMIVWPDRASELVSPFVKHDEAERMYEIMSDRSRY